jgi:hypothetical protein
VTPTVMMARRGTERARNQGIRRFQAPSVIAGGPTVKMHGNRRMRGKRSREANDMAKALLSPYFIEMPSTTCSTAYGIRTIIDIC